MRTRKTPENSASKHAIPKQTEQAICKRNVHAMHRKISIAQRTLQTLTQSGPDKHKPNSLYRQKIQLRLQRGYIINKHLIFILHFCCEFHRLMLQNIWHAKGKTRQSVVAEVRAVADSTLRILNVYQLHAKRPR